MQNAQMPVLGNHEDLIDRAISHFQNRQVVFNKLDLEDETETECE